MTDNKITINPIFDTHDNMPVAGQLSIGAGNNEVHIDIEFSELLKLREQVNFLVDRIFDAEFERAQNAD